MYPQELYREDIYRCVHSDEERDAAIAQGWQEYREAGKTYKPISAVAPEKPAKAHVIGEGDKKAAAAEVPKPAAKAKE